MDVVGIISPCLLVHHHARIRPDARLFEDLGIDGVMRVAIAVEIENECGVVVPDEEVDCWATVADITASVERHQQASCTPAAEAQGGG